MFDVLLAAAALAAPVPLEASEILRRSDRAVLGDLAAYTFKMTVERPGKPVRVVELKGWKKGDGKGLVRYAAPPKERGTAYLRDGDSTWLYIPSGEKVVRVGAKQNFGGGDFSNADIFRLSLVKDYDASLAGEETVGGFVCHKLDLKARDRKIAYDRVLLWIRTDGTYFPVRTEYFTISGKKLKWLTFGAARRLGSRVRPTLLVMESALEPGASTRLEFLTIDDDPSLDDRMFTPSALEKGE
jgi:outer membrane lipoprotein-sorting protein